MSSWQKFDFISGREQELDDDEEDEDEEVVTESEGGWISWFCSLEGHDIFCEVDDEYIRDKFNLYGLKSKVQNFDQALEMILGNDPPDEEEMMDSDVVELCRDASDLYGLIHARFILSPKGLGQVKDRYLHGRFGFCPRVLCNRQHVIPTGLTEEPRVHRARIFCPNCQECYDTKTSTAKLDGAFFGPSLPGIFLQAYPFMVPLEVPVAFTPRIFGFVVNKKRSTIQHKIEKGEYGMKIAQMVGSKPLPCPLPVGPPMPFDSSDEEDDVIPPSQQTSRPPRM